jgi:rare lipoprotein A
MALTAKAGRERSGNRGHERGRATCRRLVRFGAGAVAAATLGACAQSSLVQRDMTVETASVEPLRLVPAPAREHVDGHADAPLATRKNDRRIASQGLASFYRESRRTASGEKFSARELTAAHPTLPFGTKLRVTNVSTGKSVTVRVNDRGPFVHGRVVDVSYAAADQLGMVGKGVANVRLDVVE